MIKSILVEVVLSFHFFSLPLICFADEQLSKKENMMELSLEELNLAQEAMKEESLKQHSLVDQVLVEKDYVNSEEVGVNSIISDSKNWEISESFHYERSKYELTNVWGEIKLFEGDTTIKRCFEKWSIALTVPYIYQKSDIRITGSLLRAGRVVKISRENEKSNEGLGDFTLDGVYYFLTEDEKNPVGLMLYSYVKFPSVDEDQGLGTSEYDAGPGLGLSKQLFEKWRISADIYYIFIGDTPEQDLRNEFKFDGGLSYELTSKIALSITYEQRNALVKEITSDYEDILVGINYSLNDSISFFGEKIFELNNDYLEKSITCGLTASF